MLGTLILLLAVLWFFGYVHISNLTVPDISLFVINGQTITLWNLFILIVIMSLIGILPRPFREIASIVLLLWVLSLLHIFAIAGLSSLLVIALVVGLFVSLLSGALV